MIATALGDTVWVRYRQPMYSTEPARWFRYERQADARLHEIDAFDEPRRTLLPYGAWTYDQLYGPPSLTLPLGAVVDKEHACAAVNDHVWVNWDGHWRRHPTAEVQRIARLLGNADEAL